MDLSETGTISIEQAIDILVSSYSSSERNQEIKNEVSVLSIVLSLKVSSKFELNLIINCFSKNNIDMMKL